MPFFGTFILPQSLWHNAPFKNLAALMQVQVQNLVQVHIYFLLSNPIHFLWYYKKSIVDKALHSTCCWLSSQYCWSAQGSIRVPDAGKPDEEGPGVCGADVGWACVGGAGVGWAVAGRAGVGWAVAGRAGAGTSRLGVGGMGGGADGTGLHPLREWFFFALALEKVLSQ